MGGLVRMFIWKLNNGNQMRVKNSVQKNTYPVDTGRKLNV